ncbi:hypothetical protein FB459_1044 [Yimella lutea]|uniref:4-amino-4-deoxy-L-arabinose transferase-like glycosyltransferase n=1 Tax=Yimella lutea TaxID=587872 RepID=A0A542EE49_9MICO|nr:hypothetical protein [Yimella lutea]TQJ13618.1 hypothetical protein FB459_1044 [Yimella lutea]
MTARTQAIRTGSGLGSLITYATLLLALLGWMTWAVMDQLPIGSLVKAVAATGVFQVLPGAMVWRAIRPRNGWLLEDLAMGFAMGFAIAVPAQTIAGLMHSRIPAYVVPLLFVAVFAAVPVLRRRVLEARWSPLPWWLGPALGLMTLAAYPQTEWYFKQNLLWSDKPWTPYIDTYLHQALAAQILTRGPVSWPTVAGEDLGYQWFAHAWMAHVTATSGVPLDHVLMRFLPAIMPIVAVASIAVLGLRLSGSPGVGALSAAFSMLVGSGQPWGLLGLQLPITPLSPTLGLGIPTLVAMVLVLATRWRGEALRGAFWLIPWLTVIATGTKGSTSPVVIAGLGLAAAAMLIWNRPMFWPVVRDAVVIGVSLIVTMVVVFHGSVAGLKLGVTNSAKQTSLSSVIGGVASREQVLFVSAAVIIAGLTRAALAFALPFRRESRLDPVSWVLIGAAIAGAAALGLFSHPGRSQSYFTLTAIPLAATGSAIGARHLWLALGRRRALLLGALSAVAAFVFFKGILMWTGRIVPRKYDQFWQITTIAAVVVLVAAVIGALVVRRQWWRGALTTVALIGLFAGAGSWIDTYRTSVPVPDERPATLTSQNATTVGMLRAARYIREHSEPTDLVMTNRHCTTVREPRGGCDSRRWLVSAFSERQMLVEGWTATPRATKIAPNGRDSITVDYWKPEILELNDTFIAAPTADAQRRLWDLGVRWVYVETTRPHADDLAPYATLGIRTPTAAAWKLSPPR